jgi:hypothetical protein
VCENRMLASCLGAVSVQFRAVSVQFRCSYWPHSRFWGSEATELDGKCFENNKPRAFNVLQDKPLEKPA